MHPHPHQPTYPGRASSQAQRAEGRQPLGEGMGRDGTGGGGWERRGAISLAPCRPTDTYRRYDSTYPFPGDPTPVTSSYPRTARNELSRPSVRTDVVTPSAAS